MLVINSGKESGKFVWVVDRARSRLPSLLDFRDDPQGVDRNGFFEGLSGDTEGMTRRSGTWYLRLDVTEKDPVTFARKLGSIEDYRIVVEYYTDIVGRSSERNTLVIEGNSQNLRQQVLSYWGNYDNLAHLATECSCRSYVGRDVGCDPNC